MENPRSEPLFSGFLLKEGAGLVKTYKRRWFRLEGWKLFYFKSQKDSTPTGSIDLHDTYIGPNTAKEYGFTICGPKLPRDYNLASENESGREAWKQAIENFMAEGTRVAEETIFTGQALEKVGLKDFEELKVIGRGSFGKVMKVRRRGTSEIYAMKALRKDVVERENMIQNTKAEKTVLQNIDHPYIVKLHWAFQTPERLYLILDLLPGGEIFFHLKAEGIFTEDRARIYVAQVASSLTYLHSQGIVYRDLKPENIVLDRHGNACLTDFGLAKEALGGGGKTYTFCGTPEYIAPEILEGVGHGKGVDWWALGVLLYEMLTGLPPFYSENVNEMYALILEADLTFPEHVSNEAREFLVGLLQRDPDQRTGAEGVMESDFLKPIDRDMLEKKQMVMPFVPQLDDDQEKYVDPVFKEEDIASSICVGGGNVVFDDFSYAKPTGLLNE